MVGKMDVIDRDEEDKRIKVLIETPSLDWGSEVQFGFQPRVWSRKNITTPGCGRGGLPNKKPHEGYVCRRCNIPGHFIQHCSTNGDPNFDIKVLRRPRGVPRTMLQVASDGPYLLDSGEVAIVVPDESSFDREMEGMTSRQLSADIPAELHCPLCKNVMKDAMFTSKCCFRSFCDNCIRKYIISNKMCACGAMGVLADDLIPNKTIRETINRYMGTPSSSCASTVTSMHIGNKQAAHSTQEDSPTTTRSLVAEIEANKKPDKKSAENGQTAITSAQGAPNGSSTKNMKKINRSTRAHETHWDSGMTLYPSAYNSYMVGCGMPSFTEGYMPQFMIPPYMAYQAAPCGVPFEAVYKPDPFGLQAFALAGNHSMCYNDSIVERTPMNLACEEIAKLKVVVVHRPVGLFSALFVGKSPCDMEIHCCCTCFCEFDTSISFILFMFLGLFHIFTTIVGLVKPYHIVYSWRPKGCEKLVCDYHYCT